MPTPSTHRSHICPAQVALSFLDYLLAGTSAAPLAKALNDSGLGESIVGGGTDDTLRQPVFSMGLKGVKKADVEKARVFHSVFLVAACNIF